MNEAIKTIGIIGGGLAGVSTFVQLVLRLLSKGACGKLRVVVFDKALMVGPGLAYSTRVNAHLLNMRASTMGVAPEDPESFSRWMIEKHVVWKTRYPQTGPAEEFPPRQLYGLYVRDQFENAVERAVARGIDVHVADPEVVDMRETGDHVEVRVATGERWKLDYAVLATGNLASDGFQYLRGEKGYYHSPWKLPAPPHHISPDATVCVLGSRLSAVDVAIYLHRCNHRGRVVFVSREGYLPKVQSEKRCGVVATVVLRRLQALSDRSATVQLADIVDILRTEMETVSSNGIDWQSYIWPEGTAAEVLRKDLEAARTVPLPVQEVAVTTSPVVEDLWRRLSPEDKNVFQEYRSIWCVHRHAMPVTNAEKILALLESGQLEVRSGLQSVDFDRAEDRFSVRCTRDEQSGVDEIGADVVINATGDGSNVATCESLLLQNALRSGAIRPNVFGGIDVDFYEFTVTRRYGWQSRRVFCLGSLTKGTHFYTNAADRIAAHAGRIVDNLEYVLRFPPAAATARRCVAFYVGTDLVSHLMVNHLVPALRAAGHTPVIVLPEDRTNRRRTIDPLETLRFYERELLQGHVVPHLDRTGPAETAMRTMKQLGEEYEIPVILTADVNSPTLLEQLRRQRVHIGVSLRCYQRFDKSTIKFFDESNGRLLVNLHPGLLPAYRGVMTLIRAMANGEHDHGYTLHVVNENFDEGDIVDQATMPVDYRKSMLCNAYQAFPKGVQLVLNLIDRVSHGQPVARTPQPAGRYYSFPTSKDFADYRERNLHCVDLGVIKRMLLANYSQPGSSHEEQLSRCIDDAEAGFLREAGTKLTVAIHH